MTEPPPGLHPAYNVDTLEVRLRHDWPYQPTSGWAGKVLIGLALLAAVGVASMVMLPVACGSAGLLTGTFVLIGYGIWREAANPTTHWRLILRPTEIARINLEIAREHRTEQTIPAHRIDRIDLERDARDDQPFIAVYLREPYQRMVIGAGKHDRADVQWLVDEMRRRYQVTAEDRAAEAEAKRRLAGMTDRSG